MMVAHTSIIFTPYIVLSWESRLNTDLKSLGELFFIICDEVKELDYQTALTQLLMIMGSILAGGINKFRAVSIAEKVNKWLRQLPVYIREMLSPVIANALWVSIWVVFFLTPRLFFGQGRFWYWKS